MTCCWFGDHILSSKALQQWFLNFSWNQNDLESSLKHKLLDLPPEFLIQYVCDGYQEFVCLTSSQVTQWPLVQDGFGSQTCRKEILQQHSPSILQEAFEAALGTSDLKPSPVTY